MKTAWVVALIAACGPSVGTGGDTSDTGDASSDEGPAVWPPSECPLDSSPYVSGECLDALADGCGAHANESACTQAPTAQFDGYGVRCAWATITTIADPLTCAVASVGGRCVAAGVDGVCLLPCTASPSTNEIIEVCGGPLDASAAVGAEPDDDGPCSTQQTSPPAPALCECAPASCVEG